MPDRGRDTSGREGEAEQYSPDAAPGAAGTDTPPAAPPRSEDDERLIRLLYERKDLLRGDDGYMVFWPTGNHGCFSEYNLRVIAEELKEQNKGWDAEIKAFFEEESKNVGN